MPWKTKTLMAMAATLIAPGHAAAQGSAAFDPLVYRAALATVVGGDAARVVAIAPVTGRLRVPETVVMRGGQVNERLHQFDEIPVGLPERLDAMSVTPRAIHQLGIPPGFAILDDSAATMLADGAWSALRRRAEAARGVVYLTPIAYADGGGTALVGIVWECGSGCRRMEAVWLVPDGTGGWRVQGHHRLPLQ